MVEDEEAVVRRCFVKKVFLKIPQNSQENTCARDSFLIKLQALACNFIKKETLAQVFSCEFCEISKNTFFYRKPPVAASEDGNQRILKFWMCGIFLYYLFIFVDAGSFCKCLSFRCYLAAFHILLHSPSHPV